MSVMWNDILKLPLQALSGRKVPKAALVRNANLTRLEQKALDAISRIELFAIVQKSTTRIPPHVDNERDIQSVIFLCCELTGKSSAYAELGRVIHSCFPNPTVLLFENGDEVCLSCAITRMSLAERGATVVEEIAATGGFDPSDLLHAPLLADLALDLMPQDDLYEYVRELSWRLRMGRLAISLGFYPSCAPTQRARLLGLSSARDAFAAERKAIAEERRNHNLTLNETAKLRVQQREVEKKLVGTLKEIQEICRPSKGMNSDLPSAR